MASRMERLQELQKAAAEYFPGAERASASSFQFLDNISKKRGGSAGKFEDANDKGASKLLANSISEYLGEPLRAPGEKK